jgi:hypothetical protein
LNQSDERVDVSGATYALLTKRMSSLILQQSYLLNALAAISFYAATAMRFKHTVSFSAFGEIIPWDLIVSSGRNCRFSE